MPFRFGNTCLLGCPQNVLKLDVEVEGKAVIGYSAECLIPGWFDKRPRDYELQIQDQISAIYHARDTFADLMKAEQPFFSVWLEVYASMQAFSEETGIVAPSWREMIEEMRADPTPYDTIRSLT